MSGQRSKRLLASRTFENIVNYPNAITTSNGDQGIVLGGNCHRKRLQLSCSSSSVRGAMIAAAEIRFPVKRNPLPLRGKHTMS